MTAHITAQQATQGATHAAIPPPLRTTSRSTREADVWRISPRRVALDRTVTRTGSIAVPDHWWQPPP